VQWSEVKLNVAVSPVAALAGVATPMAKPTAVAKVPIFLSVVRIYDSKKNYIV
jgi:hypothetical protein